MHCEPACDWHRSHRSAAQHRTAACLNLAAPSWGSPDACACRVGMPHPAVRYLRSILESGTILRAIRCYDGA